MLSHIPLVPGRVVRRGGDRGIEPLDHRGIAEAVRIVVQIVACDADDVESLLDWKLSVGSDSSPITTRFVYSSGSIFPATR